MIVKNGRLYLWYNTISSKELIIRVGSGSGSMEFLEIDQTTLADENLNALISVTTEENYNLWLSDPVTYENVWTSKISNITNHIFDEDRKIVIYVMIKANEAFELGEIGLFAIEPPMTYDDWVGTSIPTQDSGATPVGAGTEGQMVYDTVDSLLYTYTGGSWVSETPSFTELANPTVGDYWFDNVNFIYYLYTENVEHSEYEVMISRNLMVKQFISTSETKIIKYTINI